MLDAALHQHPRVAGNLRLGHAVRLLVRRLRHAIAALKQLLRRGRDAKPPRAVHRDDRGLRPRHALQEPLIDRRALRRRAAGHMHLGQAKAPGLMLRAHQRRTPRPHHHRPRRFAREIDRLRAPTERDLNHARPRMAHEAQLDLAPRGLRPRGSGAVRVQAGAVGAGHRLTPRESARIDKVPRDPGLVRRTDDRQQPDLAPLLLAAHRARAPRRTHLDEPCGRALQPPGRLDQRVATQLLAPRVRAGALDVRQLKGLLTHAIQHAREFLIQIRSNCHHATPLQHPTPRSQPPPPSSRATQLTASAAVQPRPGTAHAAGDSARSPASHASPQAPVLSISPGRPARRPRARPAGSRPRR